MKRLVDQLTAAARQLGEATEQALASAEAAAHVRKPVDRRLKDRRRRHAPELVELREELEDIKIRVARNSHNLEIQFARLAEIQVLLDRLTGGKAPRFKG